MRLPSLPFLLTTSLLVAGMAAPALPLEIPQDLKMMLLGEIGAKTGGASPLAESSPDNSLDTAQYLVGGGDGFAISIVGLPSEGYFPVVDAKGNLYEGEIGLIKLGKIPLHKAYGLIAERVRKSLRKNNEVYVTLKKVKTATVTVTGYVSNPGTYAIPGNMRILDALRIANNATPPLASKVDYRSVEVRNGDSTRTFDLLRYLSTGDPLQNPYLYPGDNIHLNVMDARIFVSGEVLDPVKGAIPLRPGETVGDILELLRLRHTADSGSIQLHRANAKSGEASASLLPLSEALGLRLEANDVLAIRSQELGMRPDTVVISGYVRRPGTYAIQRDGIDMAGILELAGGPAPDGDVERVFVLRHRKRGDVLRPGNPPEGALAALPAPQRSAVMGNLQVVRPEVASAVADLRLSGDFIVLEGAEAAKKGALEDGDEIHIPRQERFIYISGNVRRPGAYPYVAGADVDHYIKQAKGYSGKADRKNQFVLASFNGITQVRESEHPAAGDVIVVPAAVEYKRFGSVFLPILQIVPGVLSLIIILINQNNQ